MKTLLIYLLLASAAAAQEVTTLQQHKDFFANRARLAAIGESALEMKKRVSELAIRAEKAPVKGEFETTAEFQRRQAIQRTEMQEQATQYSDAVTKGEAEAKLLQGRIREQETGLREITVLLKLTMGPYDADRQTVSSFTPEQNVLGTYDDRVAVTTANDVLPGLKCSADVARRLREASNKGELFGRVRLESPKLALVQERARIAATTGDKWAEALTKLALGAVGGEQAATTIDPSISKTKEVDANVLRIEQSSGARYLNFFDKAGAIPAQ
jgi:hypothetical protein